MNFMGNPKGLPRLWSCLLSDYEILMNQFMQSDGWTFSHFAKCAKEMQITLLYHASVTHGRKRDEQHECIGEMILNTPKELWLHPGKLPEIESGKMAVDDDESSQPSSSASAPRASTSQASTSKEEDEYDPRRVRKWKSEFKEMGEFEIKGLDVGLKYQLGAFYLTYIMYDRQPYVGLLKIKMTPKDFEELKKFNDDLEKYNVPSLLEEYWFMLQRLRMNHAFVVTAFPDKYDIAPATRALLNCKNNEMFELIKADRRIMDVLACSTVTKETANCFKKYLELKQQYLDGSTFAPIRSKPEACSTVAKLGKDTTFLGALLSNQGVNEMIELGAQLKEMTSKPLFTHAALLGNDLTSRVFITEATKCLKRLQMLHQRDKELNMELERDDVEQGSSQGGRPTAKSARGRRGKVAKNPYKKDTGVFGRVKEDHLEDEDREKAVPTRMKASYNLWNYIRGKGFNPDQGV